MVIQIKPAITGEVTGRSFDELKKSIDIVTMSALRLNGVQISEDPNETELVIISQSYQIYGKMHMDIHDRIWIQLYMGNDMIAKFSRYGENIFTEDENGKFYQTTYELFKVVAEPETT